MKKHCFLILCAIFLGGLSFPQQMFAHFSSVDGDISVTLHVDPNDDPIPGQQAYLYFLFEDATKKFQLSECHCLVSISEQGKQLYQQQLVSKSTTHPSIWGTSLSYIFPQRAVYHITLTGNALPGFSFQPFSISWNFRVDPENSPGLVREGPSDLQIIAILSAGGIIFFALFGWFIKKEILDSEIKETKRK